MQTDAATSDLDYLAHLARDSARFAEVLAQTSPQTRVPTCPGWDADDLLWHLAEVQWFWGTIVGRGLTTYAQVRTLDNGGRPDDRDDLPAFFGQASGDLYDNLSAAGPHAPAWAWADDQSVALIRRRQAHESLIHRLDAELTAGRRSPMDAALSTDGVDEALRVMYARAPSWGHFTADPAQTVLVRTADTDASWLVSLGRFTDIDDSDLDDSDIDDSDINDRGIDDRGTTRDAPGLAVADPRDSESGSGGSAAATVMASAADLDCWLWHRPPAGRVERSGDSSVLDRLDQTIAGGID
ncbi:MAG TPA: maleylpyruvate isomerase family mycothiol-dependent enzyme [Dermatophilaceae bacterium]|nr:maleylpyruvate isomerase family mycothiol-dependent enzyme [Dermatophilaceae bacterium]